MVANLAFVEGFVHCPICNKEVKEETINAHIDRNCEDEASSKSRKSTFQPATKSFVQSSSKSLERLPQINYSMMKDGPLRKKLADAGLSAAGNRQLMIQRYSEWVTLWNANCDATRPKTRTELRREMDIWERTQGGRANSGHIGPQIRDKDFDGVAWSNKHDSDFKSLIANARKKVAKIAANDDKCLRSGSSDATATENGYLAIDQERRMDEPNPTEQSDSKVGAMPIRHAISPDNVKIQEGDQVVEPGSLPPSLLYDRDVSKTGYSRSDPDIAPNRSIQS